MSSAMINAKMTVETPNGVTYVFPRVELVVSANVEYGEVYGDPKYFYQQEPSSVKSMSITGVALPGGDRNDFIMTVTMKEKDMATCRVPELYEDDLVKITEAMGILDDLSRTGVFACEIRIKTDDVDSWVVIGYGEDAEPAILRFECDE